MLDQLEKKYQAIIDLDAKNEQTCIGYILQDEESAKQGVMLLNEDCFHATKNSHVFKMIKEVLNNNGSIRDVNFKLNSITPEDWKALDKQWDVSIDQYISACYASSMTFAGALGVAESSFRRVQEQYVRRKMYAKYKETLLTVLETTNAKDLNSTILEVSKYTEDIIDSVYSGEQEPFADMSLRVLHAQDLETVSTGFQGVDDIIEGFRAGQLITIGAGTGVGKSAFAINIAANILKQNISAAIWSFEMDEKEVLQRLFSVITSISYKTTKQAQKEERYNQIRDYLKNQESELIVKTKPLRNLNAFYLTCRNLVQKKKIKVVIIDYLQLIHLHDLAASNRTNQIEYITNNFKNIASELGITIIILSQLSREHHKRDDPTPKLSDLRDSGSIEQDSNVVMFLSQISKSSVPNCNFQDYDKAIKIVVAKNRSGSTGIVNFKYQGYITKFTEIIKKNN
jgi:replicative DNA helicase